MGELEVQKHKVNIVNSDVFLLILNTDDKNQYSGILLSVFKTVTKTNLILLKQNDNQVLPADHYFSYRDWQLLEMSRNLRPISKKHCEEHARSKLAQRKKFFISQEDNIIQASDETGGRVTKKLSQEFSRTASCLLDDLSCPDGFPWSSLNQSHFRTVPKTSRNAYGTNQGTVEDVSQSDLHLQTSICQSQKRRNSGLEDTHDMVTGFQEGSLCTHDMLTGVVEEVTYCSTSSSSGKQKKTALTVSRNSAVKITLR